jgi:hypothetical protein
VVFAHADADSLACTMTRAYEYLLRAAGWLWHRPARRRPCAR